VDGDTAAAIPNPGVSAWLSLKRIAKLDYLWDPPTEALLAAVTGAEFAVAGSQTRLVEVGESAGSKITRPAAVLRSTALTIRGTAGIPPWESKGTDVAAQATNASDHKAEYVLGDLKIEGRRS
jgi:hypothetical protein